MVLCFVTSSCLRGLEVRSPAGHWVRNDILVQKWGSFPIPDPQKVLSLNPAMECTFLEGTCAGSNLPLSISERKVRRRKVVFKPAAKEKGTPVHLLQPLDRGRTSPPLCQDERWSPKKRQRLQQSSPPMAEEGRDACGGMGETLWRMASPMEKKQRRVLAIDLEDFSTTEVPAKLGILNLLPQTKQGKKTKGTR
ncbi:hypothetical protein E2320_003294 [Naja naja]|nr:hypothetical protein E2320_003294 [Naja naja]